MFYVLLTFLFLLSLPLNPVDDNFLASGVVMAAFLEAAPAAFSAEFIATVLLFWFEVLEGEN